MKDNNRNRQQPGSGLTQRNQDSNQGQEQNTSHSGMQDENPQRGDRWNNYQTRELSDEGKGEANAPIPKSE